MMEQIQVECQPVQSQPAADHLQTLPPPPPPGDVAVLQKLSSPPFHRGKFPLLGILASVYEHVQATIRAK
jgi:hypothetical protein